MAMDFATAAATATAAAAAAAAAFACCVAGVAGGVASGGVATSSVASRTSPRPRGYHAPCDASERSVNERMEYEIPEALQCSRKVRPRARPPACAHRARPPACGRRADALAADCTDVRRAADGRPRAAGAPRRLRVAVSPPPPPRFTLHAAPPERPARLTPAAAPRP
jgi:hypothetical protein